ncbi:threo-3-hydroxy-L-aspartate ammonia-lyase [Microcoleus sp. S13_C5]|uniref:threo-3-hydroxy-L-aspartate ammonia-lyase n=1 Tax=Microcoleus sp. S13_C5 TaxID=3055411 RepID=UPI002FD0463C
MSAQNPLSVSFADVEAAANRLQGKAFKTPVLTSETLNKRTNSQVFFKCENFQRTGSFKFRGACNALMQLSEAEKQRGVLTFSSGNHAQAIALAARLLEIPATVVMPADAPKVKQEATRGYGAEIILYDRTQVAREELAAKIAEERHLTIIPPYDHAWVIAGQGTAALELIAEVGELDLLLVCCGGGGLLSGCAIAAKTLSPQCKVIGVEPQQADDAARSFRTKTLQTVTNPDTIADGARTPSLGKLTFPLVLHYVDDMATVSEEAIRSTMFFMWERMKIVVEPTGVLAAAALLSGVVQAKNARIGVIVSGGNVDFNHLPNTKGS